jgi:hypothetical protein
MKIPARSREFAYFQRTSSLRIKLWVRSAAPVPVARAQTQSRNTLEVLREIMWHA